MKLMKNILGSSALLLGAALAPCALAAPSAASAKAAPAKSADSGSNSTIEQIKKLAPPPQLPAHWLNESQPEPQSEPPAAPQLDLSASARDDDDDDDDAPVTTDELNMRLKDLELKLDQTREMVIGRRQGFTVSGYADFGFFVPQGDGSGIVRDSGNTMFPEYSGRYGWVFVGDILAPTINSRGEVADLGDAAGSERFDSVHSGGAPGFIASELNLTLSSGIGEEALATASVNFMPRTGSNFDIGDFMDIDIAQIEYMPKFLGGSTSIFAGKFDSLIGIEYRERKASQRFGITPSLLARYTVGTALGLKIRSKFAPNDFLVVAAAVTNGSNTTEQFHFYDELDLNAGKTASGRVAIRPPLGPIELEIGGSATYGAQDRARDSRGKMWFAGVDLMATMGPVDLKAQWLRGAAPGRPEDDVYGLDLRNGAYVEVDWMVTSLIGVLGRGEMRDAFVWLGDPNSPEGANRAYLTKSWRAVGGAKLVFSDRFVLKAEYLRNGEYGGIPEIRNDVLTSSLVFTN